MAAIFGAFHDLGVVQECLRAVLIFFYGLAVVRLGGRRIFAQWSALDFIMSIIVGSSLSRAVTGSAPLVGTLAAVAVLAALHWSLSWAVARSDRLSRIVEGGEVILAEHGRINEQARLRHTISHADLAEALRAAGLSGRDAIDRTSEVTLEPNGKINVLK